MKIGQREPQASRSQEYDWSVQLVEVDSITFSINPSSQQQSYSQKNNPETGPGPLTQQNFTK